MLLLRLNNIKILKKTDGVQLFMHLLRLNNIKNKIKI